MTTPPPAVLARLIAKWRRQSPCFDDRVVRETYDCCADELTAAIESLYQQSEPFAWFTEDYRDDKSATTYDPVVAERWRNKGWPVSPLFTHPAAVDEAMVERALRAFNAAPGNSDDDAVKWMRAALVAALQPASTSVGETP